MIGAQWYPLLRPFRAWPSYCTRSLTENGACLNRQGLNILCFSGTNTWKNGINDILRQGVVAVGTVDTHIINDMSWDRNKNGIFDDFVSDRYVPSEFQEIDYILQQTGNSGGTGCFTNARPAAFIFKGKIRDHWLLTEAADSGDATVVLNTAKRIFVGDTIHIGNWLDSTGAGSGLEICYVCHVDTTANIIQVARDANCDTMGLRFDHPKHSSFWNDNSTLGFTINSCAFIGENIGIETHAHEILHMRIVGELYHVKDKCNIMHPYSTGRGTKLRYRVLELYETLGNQSQWQRLKREP